MRVRHEINVDSHRDAQVISESFLVYDLKKQLTALNTKSCFLTLLVVSDSTSIAKCELTKNVLETNGT